MFKCDCPPYNCAEKTAMYLDGDQRAGDELAEKFEPLVARIVQRTLGPTRRDLWDDVCQAAFLRVFAKLDTWEGRCPFCRWLAIVVGRRAIDALRTRTHGQIVDPAAITDHRETALSPEAKECIERAIAALRPAHRQVWDLWFGGADKAEIARRLGKKERTVQLAIASIRSRLERCCDQ